MRNLFLGSILFLFITSSLFAGTYKVDPIHSHIGFKIKHLMISNVRGEFDKFDGDFKYNEKTKKLEALNGKVKVSSIDTRNKDRDRDLKRKKFFNAKTYPTLTFKLAKVSANKLYGFLTIRGVTKKITLNYEINGVIKDPWGNQKAGIYLSGKINRKDFGLKYNKTLETGGFLLGETVQLDIELEGVLVK